MTFLQTHVYKPNSFTTIIHYLEYDLVIFWTNLGREEVVNRDSLRAEVTSLVDLGVLGEGELVRVQGDRQGLHAGWQGYLDMFLHLCLAVQECWAPTDGAGAEQGHRLAQAAEALEQVVVTGVAVVTTDI